MFVFVYKLFITFFMVISTVGPGLQELQWNVVAGLSLKKNILLARIDNDI